MIYSIQNEHLQVQVKSHGGELTSIKDAQGKEYLWQGDTRYWSGQAPVLFPIVGTLRNHSATIGGDMTCSMQRHGIARKQEFTTIASSPDSIVFSLVSNDELKKQYPFDFELQIQYAVRNLSVITSYSVINTGQDPLPFCIGGHPAFNCPLEESENFDDYILEFEYNEIADCFVPMPDGLIDPEDTKRILDNTRRLPLKHSLFKPDALVFDSLQSDWVKLYHKYTKKGLQVSFPEFDYLGIWSSANDGPFVAIEPWTGISTCTDEDDIFENKRGVTILPSDESFQINFEITLI